jgi:hypothetical protein
MIKSINSILLFLFMAPFLLVFLFWTPYFFNAHYGQQITVSTGNETIRNINLFQKSHHRLPATLEEIGMKGDDLSTFKYKRINDRDFEIMYSLSVGELSIFHSNTNTWKFYH